MSGDGDEVRRAMAALNPQERRAVRDQAAAGAAKWGGHLPRVAALWVAVAELADEIEGLERARQAAGRLDTGHRRPGRP